MFKTSVKGTLLLICLMALPALPAEGRIPVWQSPTVITLPGQYILTRTLTPNTGGPVIDIQAPEVDLDLNGYTVDNLGSPFPAIQAATADRVRIHNGFVLGGSENIAAPGGGTRIVIEGIKAQQAAGQGFYLFDTEVVILKDNLITGSGQEAIRIDGGIWKNGLIERNVIKHAPGGIYVVNGSSFVIRLNQMEDITDPTGAAGFSGITLSGSHGILVEQNTVQVAHPGGIDLSGSTGCKLYNNVIKEVEQFGILVDVESNDNFLVNNVVTGTLQGDGFAIDGDRNHLDDNLANQNGICGIHFYPTADGNVYRKNVARGNLNCSPFCAAIATTDFCDDGTGNSTNNDNFLPAPGM